MPPAVQTFLGDVSRVILNPIIGLAFAVAFVVFVWGVFQFILSQTSDDKREEGKRKILWGLVGMFIMFSVYGIISLILNTFGIPPPGYIPV
jgi:hypothetical protein